MNVGARLKKVCEHSTIICSCKSAAFVFKLTSLINIHFTIAVILFTKNVEEQECAMALFYTVKLTHIIVAICLLQWEMML